MTVPPTQLKWPLKLDAAGGFVEVPQDSAEEILCAGGLLLDTRPGQLPWAPNVGTPSPLGTNDPQATALTIESALNRHEPRGDFVVSVLSDPGVDGRNVHLSLNLEDAE